mmetsp:Transcript_68400/g.187455  ORF Transcript_68400/g.187455 Transcript_68400/m.187455 type:complete len:398 (-) Transcript_68400:1214-2407(-)|eukprot:7391990-Prymnesium_polylepis.3
MSVAAMSVANQRTQDASRRSGPRAVAAQCSTSSWTMGRSGRAIRSWARHAATARVVRSTISLSVHADDRGSQHQSTVDAPSRMSSSMLYEGFDAVARASASKELSAFSSAACAAAMAGPAIFAKSLGSTATRRTCAAACAASSAVSSTFAVDVGSPPLPLASQENEFVSARPAALTSASASAATSTALAVAEPQASGAPFSASTAETTCCAADAAQETAEAVAGSESIESTARAAEVAADASLAASAAALAACATRATASLSHNAAVAGVRPPPAWLAAPLTPTSTMAFCTSCVAARSLCACRAFAAALAAEGAATEEAAVAAAAAIDAVDAAAMTSAVWLLGTPARIACVTMAAACMAALRALDADASAADRPTLLADGPFTHSASRRICDVGIVK